MTSNRLGSLLGRAATFALLLAPGALSAQMPLTQDEAGNVWFRTPNRTVLKIGIKGDVAIDNRVLVNCRQNPGSEVDLAAGEVECYGGYYEVTDRFGNELTVYPTMAEANGSDGSKYEKYIARSPVRVRIDISGGDVRVETDAETVTVGAGGDVKVEGLGQEIVVDGDDFRIRSGGAEVRGDWRGVTTRYGAADTDRILGELGATKEGDLIQLALAGDILFDFDSTAIRQDAAEQLAKAAHVVRQRAVGEIYVVGHTDSVGEAAYNDKLSQERAAATMSWLHSHESIPATIMIGRGMGSSKPVAYNTMPDGSDNPSGRSRNRRVEILLATREGVDLVDVAGLVKVSGEAVEVAGLVKVSGEAVEVGGGAIRVEEGGVRVGGVEVTPEGIRIGDATLISGTAANAKAISDTDPVYCKGNCEWSCPQGDCNMVCVGGSACDFSCTGGDCAMTCAGGAKCDFDCSGGDCAYTCAGGAGCRTTCTGGGCTCSGRGCP